MPSFELTTSIESGGNAFSKQYDWMGSSNFPSPAGGTPIKVASSGYVRICRFFALSVKTGANLRSSFFDKHTGASLRELATYLATMFSVLLVLIGRSAEI
jgi:hypothetical protein